jgi:hypothetical protein
VDGRKGQNSAWEVAGTGMARSCLACSDAAKLSETGSAGDYAGGNGG